MKIRSVGTDLFHADR